MSAAETPRHAEPGAADPRRVPATVFACLLPGELRLTLWPGAGLVDGGIPINVPAHLIPRELRMPNTRLWVEMDDIVGVVRVWRGEA